MFEAKVTMSTDESKQHMRRVAYMRFVWCQHWPIRESMQNMCFDLWHSDAGPGGSRSKLAGLVGDHTLLIGKCCIELLPIRIRNFLAGTMRTRTHHCWAEKCPAGTACIALNQMRWRRIPTGKVSTIFDRAH